MSIGSVFLNFPTDAANTIPYVTDLKSFYALESFQCVYFQANLQLLFMSKKVKVAQSCPLPLCDPKNYTVHGILWARILFSLSLLQGIFLTQGSKGIEPRSSALQVDSLSAEPQGKPKNK